jgi:hypothetical protein
MSLVTNLAIGTGVAIAAVLGYLWVTKRDPKAEAAKKVYEAGFKDGSTHGAADAGKPRNARPSKFAETTLPKGTPVEAIAAVQKLYLKGYNDGYEKSWAAKAAAPGGTAPAGRSALPGGRGAMDPEGQVFTSEPKWDPSLDSLGEEVEDILQDVLGPRPDWLSTKGGYTPSANSTLLSVGGVRVLGLRAPLRLSA